MTVNAAKIISGDSRRSKIFGCFISDIVTNEGDFKLSEPQVINGRENLKPNNNLVICSKVCNDHGREFCTKNSKCKCYGQFFYSCSQNMLRNIKQRWILIY